MIKKCSLLFATFIFLILISGCETIEAVGTGEMKMQDIAQMGALGIANTGEIGEKSTISRKIEEIDTWMHKNLW